MTLVEMVRSLRRDLDDTVEPFLWSTVDLKDYINHAVTEAAARALLIYDETSSVTQLDGSPRVGVYPLDNSVIDVDRVLYDGRSLVRATKMQLDSGDVNPFDSYTGSGPSTAGRGWESRVGTPYAFVEEVNSIRLYPKPSVAGRITLSLWRTPLEPLAQDDDEPEIQASYHDRILDWALHRAFSKRDTDAEDVRRALLHEQRFTASFGERRDANVQRKQKIKRIPVCRPRW